MHLKTYMAFENNVRGAFSVYSRISSVFLYKYMNTYVLAYIYATTEINMVAFRLLYVQNQTRADEVDLGNNKTYYRKTLSI